MCVLEPLTPEPPPKGGGGVQGPGSRVAAPKPPMALAWDLSPISRCRATQERAGRPMEFRALSFTWEQKRPDEPPSVLSATVSDPSPQGRRTDFVGGLPASVAARAPRFLALDVCPRPNVQLMSGVGCAE